MNAARLALSLPIVCVLCLLWRADGPLLPLEEMIVRNQGRPAAADHKKHMTTETAEPRDATQPHSEVDAYAIIGAVAGQPESMA